MTISDAAILLKKILVGIIVYLIPVIIIFGGLWLTKRVFINQAKAASSENYSIKH
jgi:hypothetical protein